MTRSVARTSEPRVHMIPRLHLFEIDDQSWFPPYLRGFVQASLTRAWTAAVPYFQPTSPARLVAQQIHRQLGEAVRDYVFIDFCSGAGGPTPSIEQHLNAAIGASAAPHGPRSDARPNSSGRKPVQVVMTDLHPHLDEWRRAVRHSSNLSYIEQPVDATNAPRDLMALVRNGERPESGEAGGDHTVERGKAAGQTKKVFRLFSLAFHHFDDGQARKILENTVETSHALGIFELQERNLLGFLTCAVFGVGIMATAPYYAWVWGSPMALFFVYAIPIIPFVLVFDGLISALRTRTPSEVEYLLRTCQAPPGDIDRWDVYSGKEMFLWPVGFMNWIICVRRDGSPGARGGPTPAEAQWMGSSTARRAVAAMANRS